MATRWRLERPTDLSWKAPAGMSQADRCAEQDVAAGSRGVRAIPTGVGSQGTASIALRLPQPGRRVYAYLRWNAGGRTIERYVGEVSGQTRAELLEDGWRKALANDLLPRTSDESRTANSWASTPAVRTVMRANPRKDTKPERRLRSLLHGMGLRYRVDNAPIAGVRGRADLVFSRAKVAVFVDGCFWHGCPDHYRPAHKNVEFWQAKLKENQDRDHRTDAVLAANGWLSVRVWEHEDPNEAALRIAEALRAHSSAR